MPPKKDDKTKDDKSELAQALERMEALTKDLAPNIQKGFKDALAEIAAAQPKPKAEPKADPDDEIDPNFDLEKATRKELVEFMTKGLVSEVNKLLKPIQEQISENSTTAQRANLANEADKARAKYPDFDEFKTEMGGLIKTNPGLSLERLYLLARAENSDKAAELDKAAKEKDEQENKNSAETEPFGGFFPPGLSDNKEESKGKMTQNEAAEDAWDKAMADVPTSAFGTN